VRHEYGFPVDDGACLEVHAAPLPDSPEVKEPKKEEEEEYNYCTNGDTNNYANRK
jgi:hypothetical protein